MATEICNLCRSTFTSTGDYVAHNCAVTGYTPADLAHGGTIAVLVAKESLKRSGSLTKEREAELDEVLDSVKNTNVDDAISRAVVENKKAGNQ